MRFANFFIDLLLLLSSCLDGFKCFRVVVDLPSDSVIVLGSFSIHQANLAEDFSDFPQRIDLADVVPGAIQELMSSFLNSDGLFLVIASVGDAASIR
jgi:hypothetical protein